MRCIVAVVLGVGLVGSMGLPTRSNVQAQDKKEEKKDPPKKDTKPSEPPNLEGKYTLVDGKINDKVVDEAAKKYSYVFAADTITITGPEPKKDEKKDEKPLKFVFSYKLDAATTPVQIDMAILDGPEGTKGSKATGIVQVKGDVLKLAYTMEKDKRPQNFEGKESNAFEFRKLK